MGYRFVLADGSITSQKIASGAVTGAKICTAESVFCFPLGVDVRIENCLLVMGLGDFSYADGILLPGDGPYSDGSMRFTCGQFQVYCGGAWRTVSMS